jgi:hypothetical protein
MLDISPPFAARMGGEGGHDLVSIATVVFGHSEHDTFGEFLADCDRPNSFNDYPVRRCAATGHLGARHAMTCVNGRWYLRRYAPERRI